MDESLAAEPASPPASAPAHAGRRLPLLGQTSGLVRIGLLIFGVGIVLIAVEVIGFFLGVRNWPLWLNVCSGAFAPAGMALALVGVFSAGRRDQRDALRAVNQQ
jgi:hypothetical protein